MTKVSNCKACNAPIIWLINIETDRKMPVNLATSPDGSIALLSDEIHFRVLKSEARKMYKEQGGVLHKSHFSTCPETARFRNRK